MSPERRLQLARLRADQQGMALTAALQHVSAVLAAMTATLVAARRLALALQRSRWVEDEDPDTLTESDLPRDRQQTV